MVSENTQNFQLSIDEQALVKALRAFDLPAVVTLITRHIQHPPATSTFSVDELELIAAHRAGDTERVNAMLGKPASTTTIYTAPNGWPFALWAIWDCTAL